MITEEQADIYKLHHQMFKHKLSLNEIIHFPDIPASSELKIIKKCNEDLARLIADISTGGLDLLPHYIKYLLEMRKDELKRS